MAKQTTIGVVGAGPTGLSAAILLRQRGYSPIVLDRRPSLAGLPSAHVVNTRSQEVFAEMGVADAMHQAGDPKAMSSLVAWVESMAGRQYGLLPIAAPTCDERGPLSAFTSVNIPQTVLEPILMRRLEELGGAVRFGQEVTGVAIVDDRARVTIGSPDGGETSILHCDWLIGCDGAGSAVRRSLGIEMEGPRTIARFMTIYFHADLDRYREGREGVLYWIGGCQARGVFICFTPRDWAMLVPIGELSLEAFDDDAVRRIVHKAIGTDSVAVTLQGLSTWNMSAQVATDYRRGPVLLAGDACHRFPPTGGLGMNTGIQDVHNLVWKLDAVIEGAPDALLDSYAVERRPVAQRNTAQSVGNLMKMAMIDQALGVPTLEPIAADAARGPIATHDAALLGMDGDGEAAVARRAEVQAAIDAQLEHFAQGAGLDLGVTYAEGRFVPDGSSPPTTGPLDYRPDAHPGARLPHAAGAEDGFAASTLGRVRPDGITLFAAEPRWQQVASRVAAETGTLVHPVLVDGGFASDRLVLDLLGIDACGAVAVRPDHHVLWRTPVWPDDPDGALLHAVRVGYGVKKAGFAPNPTKGSPLETDG